MTARTLAPVKLELLITIVDMKRAAYYAALIQSHDCNLQIHTAARGTAGAALLDVLGLTDSAKACLFSVVRADRLDDIMADLEEKFKTVRDGNGIAVSIPLTSVIGKLIFGFLSNDRGTVRTD